MTAVAHLDTTPLDAPPLDALAVQNGPILRRLAAGPPPASVADLARQVGRDKDNLRKTLKRLQAAGLVDDAAPVPTLAAAGRTALAALDRAAGGGEPAAGLEVPHARLRPNPLNPRRTLDPAAIEALADTIEADGGILQNLVVSEPDASGARLLYVGERRWRAVGRLIERGSWPAERGLPCVERAARDGEAGGLGVDALAAFLGLVENGQREDLDPLEEARAYAALIQATGWSKAEAAKRTGKSPRVVQEAVKVVEEARPEDLALYEAHRGGRDCADCAVTHSWEWLRHSVRQPGAGAPAAGGLAGLLDGVAHDARPAAARAGAAGRGPCAPGARREARP